MCNQFSHTIGAHAAVFIMCRSNKISIYTVLISAIDGENLLVLVRVRHDENAQTFLPTL